MDILTIAELSYYIAGSGEPVLKFRLPSNGNSPQIVAKEHIQSAIEQRGIWDQGGTVFYPWHSILRIEATGSELNAQEIADRVRRASILGTH